MNPERFARIKELVLTAATLPEGERARYLDSACGGDGELRAEAEAFLAQDGRAPDLVRTGAIDHLLGMALGRTLAEMRAAGGGRRIPEVVGPYRIAGLLGEGGMGVVYRAWQERPIRREVALKLLRSGLGSAAVLARFETERQTLARLGHPNVATILDAGTHEDGQPYFVMELVRGLPITEYCRSVRMPTVDRVRLFLGVCRAVRHAHRRGVIHRDLKPSNILVTLVQGEPVPKVIDFSIAKALDAPGPGTELRTRTGQVVGTLEYMSPEQARGAVHEIDTRSDVYALGAVLYELLADRLPHDLAGVPLHEAVRRIVEDPPPRLRGTRAGTTLAARSIPADLETITGKCLEKAPDRRYGSAAELSEDLERHLDSRPILARPPSTVYQLRKLVRRHRFAAAFLTTVLVFLLAFAVTMTLLFQEQRRERLLAESEARRARAASQAAQQVLFNLSSKVPDELRERMRGEMEGLPGEFEARGLMQTPEERAAIYSVLAGTYSGIQMLREARPLIQRALAEQCEVLRRRHPERTATWDRLESLVSGNGGSVPISVGLADAAQGADEQLQQDLRAVADQLFELGFNSYVQREFEQAVLISTELVGLGEVLFEETAHLVDQGRSMLASSLSYLRRYDEAEAVVRGTIERSRRLHGEDAGQLEHAEVILGMILADASRFDAAEEVLRSGLDRCIRGESVNIPTAQHRLGLVLQARGKYEEALDLHRRAVAWREEQGAGTSHHTAIALGGLGLSLAALGRLDEARPVFERALAISEELRGLDHVDTIADWTDLGVLHLAAGDPRQAAAHLERAFQGRDTLVAVDPLEGARLDLAVGWLRLRQGRPTEAEQLLRRALDVRRGMLPEGDARTAVAAVLLAASLRSLGRDAEAAALAEADPDRLGPPAHPIWVAAARESVGSQSRR